MPERVEVVGVQPPTTANIEAMAAILSSRIDSDVRRVFFGHSFGALLAYAVARRMPVAPELLVVSGSRAPHVPVPVPLRDLPDRYLDLMLGRMGGMSPAQLADPELMARFRPRVRTDLSICESYEAPVETLDGIPISAWAGRDDWYAPSWLTRPWQRFAPGRFRHRLFDGGHFFINAVEHVVDALLDDIEWAATQRALPGAGDGFSLTDLAPSDRAELLAMAGRCSPDTLRSRFLSVTPTAATSHVETLLRAADCRTVVVRHPSAGIVGFGSLFLNGTAPAEVALLVEDGFQSQGLGRRLLDTLHAHAEAENVAALEMTALVGNSRMIRLFRDARFSPAGAGAVTAVLPVQPAPVGVGRP